MDGKALSIANDSTSTGAQLVASDYSGGDPSQQWDLVDAGNGWYNVKNVRSAMFLDVSFGGAADNATVWQWTSNNGGAGQKWRLQPWGTYYLRAECSGKYIGSVSAANGAAVVQHAFEVQPWYQWVFNSRGDGWCSLQNLYAPGRAISSPNSSTTVGQSLSILDYNLNNIGDQVARMVPHTNGTFGYFFKFDNLAWDLQYGSQADMAPLTQWTTNTGTAQQFRMERVQ